MLKVYNTMTRQKETFRPIKPGEVSIYCCGVTPYNAPHIGNARPFVTWDVIRRYFAARGYQVHYIQNFTDVDDKIINTANKEHTTWKDVADRNIAIYFHSMDALGVRRADIYPRVSETMADIIDMVQTLIDKGYAYALDNGDVFYSVEKFHGYGKLSGRQLSDMQAGARIEVDERKHHPMDFALWKSAKPGEPSWDSPWGKGRPGWHIECSTMSLKYLGEKFDFHGGGSDLIFPHHENEIAQSQACIGDDHSFAQYWLHNGFITIHNEKMSKSKNNFFTVEDILKEYPGEVVRFFILQTHYRSPLDFSEDRIKEAQTSLGRLLTTQGYVQELAKKTGDSNTAAALAEKAAACKAAFDAAMDDDFNTALAISEMFALSKEINIYFQSVTDGAAFDAKHFADVKAAWDYMAGIIGLFAQQEVPASDGLAEKLMDLIIAIRQDARKEKNWPLADRIRDELKAAGVALEDTKSGVRWKRI